MKRKPTISYDINILDLVSVILLILGGLLGYLLVNKYESELTRIELQYAAEDLALKRERDTVATAGNMVNMLSNLQPNIEVLSNEFVWNGNEVSLIVRIKNIGRHTVHLRQEELSLFSLTPKGGGSAKLVQNEAYQVIEEFPAQDVLKSQEQTLFWKIKFIDMPNFGALEYRVRTELTTDPAVQLVLSEYLKDVVDDSLLSEKSRRSRVIGSIFQLPD